MIKIILYGFGLILSGLLISCDAIADDIYERSSGLKAKLYSQLKAQPVVSMFLTALKPAVLFEVIEKSEYFAVMRSLFDKQKFFLGSAMFLVS